MSEMNFFNAFRVAEKARHALEEVLGSTYYSAPLAANQISDLAGLASKVLQAIERIGIRNRNEYTRKDSKPFRIDRKAFNAFFRSLSDELDGLPPEETPETPKTTRFSYKVLVEVEFSDGEMELLRKLSGAHYDSWCRSVSAVGGFLYGMTNRQQFAREDNQKPPVFHMPFRDIDTLCKILEGRPQLHPEVRPTADALALRLSGLLKDINTEHERVNPRTP